MNMAEDLKVRLIQETMKTIVLGFMSPIILSLDSMVTKDDHDILNLHIDCKDVRELATEETNEILASAMAMAHAKKIRFST